MKKYLERYKPFLQFLGLFFISYLIFTLCYQYYLGTYENNEVDGFTRVVSINTAQILQVFTEGSYVIKNASQDYMKLIYCGKYVAKIVEGCNAMSVIILFASFIIAFSGRFKPTFSYIVLGSLFIYILNVIRIALLSSLIFYYPEQETLLHGVIFPLYIYGVVFILWIYWVQKHSKYASEKTK
ncbi:exosortase family protein XrtF [Flavobacterium sp. CHNK8]|uniref:exosortase family protein XrtF n=1 Tax=Flavobacterium sp. CHNK8 TaxID=2871165 RepID=UPI001C8F06FE|nr:exosortase family protein XrtF [Flavobacterium sp. CHNK8]QZK91243.1 exosortase family protein XrtF [Flavobacterium sp. CHNK8]